jgi:eukaryotic-like serine/threonine-protein kinase
MPKAPSDPPPTRAPDDPADSRVDLALGARGPVELPGRPPERRGIPPSLAERYEDIQFVGEGGMGTVYRGMDPRLGRTVALKLLKGDDPELWRRFLVEARAQARIQHDHVCRVYEAGQANGEPYIAMQFIDGEPLSRLGSRLTLEQRVKVMREVSAAVHEAHRLGMIHRDIKPGNVLVEEREDGSLKPYIMDFGLVREVEDQGQTQTGAVLGTPAYMPPEQAKGDVRSMDRRSDVYSLGATLYDVIAGQPPFVAEHPWKLLMMVAYEEPPALRAVKKGVPPELETIVMKCLEREPERRYESARALAEELQRFLDGDPIQAKRASFGYVVLKKVKKHKVAASFGAVLLCATLGVSGAWVRAGRQAAERARLAQALGEDVKEMELFLRNAYSMPLHDVERERDVVRGRLAEIAGRMAVAGEVGEGPGHYALGRGALALGDPAGAREQLEKAIAAGYSSPELEYALGRALGELFRRALDETRRITNEDERKKKVGELEKELRDPALVHLRAASGAKLEAPAYAEGLIALYEGRNDEAQAKGKEAFEKAPWMYEAKNLEGDALFAEGSKYRHDAAFDYERMKSYFMPAVEAYTIAAEMGRSDPEVHRVACELWAKIAEGTSAMGKSPDGDFDAAEAACARAVRSSSRDGAARVQRALVSTGRFFAANTTATNLDAAEKAAIEAVNEAVRVRPRDAMALYAQASTFYVRAMRQAGEGEQVAVAEAIGAFERVLEIEPRFTWALNELGQSYLLQAEVDRLRGRDPRRALDNASKQFDRAIEVDPSFSLPVFMKIRASIHRLVYETEHGIDAKATLSTLSGAVGLLDRQKSGGWLPVFWKAMSLRVRAAYELSMGADPRGLVAEGLAVIDPFAKPGAETLFLLRERVELRLLGAEHALRSGLEPLPDLGAEREALQKEITNHPAEIDGPVLVARIALLGLRGRAREKKVDDADFEAAFAPLQPVLSSDHDPRAYQVLAEIHAQKAVWLEERGKAPDADVERGLAMAEKVLAINPHSAMAFGAKGQLLLARARGAKGEDRRAAARAAREAFAAALRENPRLEAEYAAAIKEAAGMS